MIILNSPATKSWYFKLCLCTSLLCPALTFAVDPVVAMRVRAQQELDLAHSELGSASRVEQQSVHEYGIAYRSLLDYANRKGVKLDSSNNPTQGTEVDDTFLQLKKDVDEKKRKCLEAGATTQTKLRKYDAIRARTGYSLQ